MTHQQQNSNWIVMKFGGTSVSSLACWQNIADVAKHHLHNHPKSKLLIVCSAPHRVSNYLAELLQHAPNGNHNNTLEKIRTIYAELATDLNLKLEDYLTNDFEQLNKLSLGVSLVNEASPRVCAHAMAHGELMLTRLATAYLQQHAISTAWHDARKLLVANTDPNRSDRHNFLSASCDYGFDEMLLNTLNAETADVIVTQGFIASNAHGDTVLLGRGGSDVSAAYLAAKLNASRCEIWTDVPGIYSANPKDIPQARLLKTLSYDETQEIASMGAKVLHPRCIQPVKHNNIPLYVKYTREPQRAGTKITNEATHDSAQIKSIINKHDILLISVEAISMWQAVGFLSKVFDCFSRHGLSIDLVSTSESSVTVSLDTKANLIEKPVIDALLKDLNQFAHARSIGPCASISLVGHHIRTILHKLGEVFNVFESQQVHLLSQAANDLNLTFVVDEEQAPRLSQQLHHLLIEQNVDSLYFGNSWQQDFGQPEKSAQAWWQTAHTQLLQIAKTTTPAYVYAKSVLQANAAALQQCDAIDNIFYAIKANSHPDILQIFYNAGINFECVSIFEVEHILKLFPDIDPKRILFTPNFAPRREYEHAQKLGIYITLDNLYALEQWGNIFRNHNIILRIDPGHGQGHHKYVCTGGTQSKFGIPINLVNQAKQLADQHHIHIIGLHTHAGSGILDPYNWQHTAETLLTLLDTFPEVEILNLGGGLGICEKPGQKPLDLVRFNESLKNLPIASNIKLWLEPGRYLVGNAGALITTVTQLKQKGELCFVGVDTGMNTLIRPALYGSYHEIINLTKLNAPRNYRANIVGPICESGDTLGYSRLIATPTEGDVILIANTGAYGRSMSSTYNLRNPAEEIVID